MITWFINLSLLEQFIIIFLTAINIISFFYIGIDKLKAQLVHRRVPEKILWLMALLGGSLGTLLGMRYFRHKTQKLSFQAVLAMILVAQVLIGYFLL